LKEFNEPQKLLRENMAVSSVESALQAWNTDRTWSILPIHQPLSCRMAPAIRAVTNHKSYIMLEMYQISEPLAKLTNFGSENRHYK